VPAAAVPASHWGLGALLLPIAARFFGGGGSGMAPTVPVLPCSSGSNEYGGCSK
jgi:hypothetical protein